MWPRAGSRTRRRPLTTGAAPSLLSCLSTVTSSCWGSGNADGVRSPTLTVAGTSTTPEPSAVEVPVGIWPVVPGQVVGTYVNVVSEKRTV